MPDPALLSNTIIGIQRESDTRDCPGYRCLQCGAIP